MDTHNSPAPPEQPLPANDLQAQAWSITVLGFRAISPDAQAALLQTLVNAGVSHKQLDDSPTGWAKALDCYERVLSLGESLFDALNDVGKMEVLNALGNAGVSHEQLDDSPTRWAKMLDCHERAIALGESRFDALNDVGKVQVLNALCNAGVSHQQLDDSPAGWAKALDCYERAIALGEFRFDALHDAGKALVLKALVHAGVSYEQLDDSPTGCARGLDCYERVLSLGEFRFDALNHVGKALVLHAMVNAGVLHRQLEDRPTGWARELDCCERAIALGEFRFDALNDHGKAQVLKALVNAGLSHGQLDERPTGWARRLDCYERVLSLGEFRFNALNDIGKTQVLKALVNAGVTHRQLDESPTGRAKGLECYERAAVLGESQFDSMENDGKASVLQSLFNAGLMHGALDSPTDWGKGLYYFERAAELGEPEFDSLDESGKWSVLAALLNAGVKHSQLDLSPTGWAKALDCYERAIALGEARFDALGGDSKSSVLNALANAGVCHGRLEDRPTGLAKSSACYKRAIALGEHELQLLNARCRDQFQINLDLLESDLYNSARRPSSAMPLSIVLLSWSDRSSHISNAQIRAQVPSRNRSADGLGSDRWLTRANAFPVEVHRREQSSTVRRLAQARLAIHAQSQNLGTLVQPGKQVRLAASIARHIAQANDWPVGLESLAHWLLALLSVHAPELVSLPSHRHWQESQWSPDIPAIARVLRFEDLRFENGAFRASYYWATLLAHSELDVMRYEYVPEDSVHASQWMGDWLDRADGKALRESLQLQWLDLVQPTQKLATWLDKQGVAEPMVIASRACLSGQADRAIAQALQSGDQSNGASRPHHGHLNYWLTELTKVHEGRQATEWALAQTLQRFCQGGLSQPGLTPDQLWELLESARVGLASKVQPTKRRWSEWDEEAVKAIHAGELRALDEAERHLHAREAGTPLPMPDQVDGPLEPFTTMAQQWQRMGVGLVFETPATAAALLRPGETLVQLWWGNAEHGPAEIGRALWLRKARSGQGGADFELEHLMLPQGLDRSAMQQILQPWAEQGRLDRLGGEDKRDVLQATQQAWEGLMAPGSAARQLLAWLSQAEVEQISLILPHELSNLPWHALREQLQQEQNEQQPSSTPVTTIELVPSVSAWAQARRASTQAKSASAKALKASLVMAHDIFDEGGQLQAQRVGEILGINPCVSNDLRDVVQALTHDDVVHLAQHGHYDDEAPQRSALLVEAQDGHAKAQLPAWVLAQLSIHADVSLATCQALQSGVGQGHAAALGPLGIGPMLMSAGARSVVGSLWQCEAWAAAVFFALWYDERRSHEAATALARARQRLRSLSYEQLLTWVEQVAPDALPQATDRCNATRQLWQRPFEHPWCWATFAVLGQAPALPALRSTALPDQPLRTGSSWTAWFVRIWRRFFG
jgi:CHAT domain-containing protein/tetratricopeptide (TPR) repeat protein